jgi:hypothetical protein
MQQATLGVYDELLGTRLQAQPDPADPAPGISVRSAPAA